MSDVLGAVGVRSPLTVSVKSEAPVRPADEAFVQSFSKVIETSARNLRNAELVAIEGVLGKASTHDVVNGLLSAERSLHAAIAVRDRLVASYQEISRMAI